MAQQQKFRSQAFLILSPLASRHSFCIQEVVIHSDRALVLAHLLLLLAQFDLDSFGASSAMRSSTIPFLGRGHVQDSFLLLAIPDYLYSEFSLNTLTSHLRSLCLLSLHFPNPSHSTVSQQQTTNTRTHLKFSQNHETLHHYLCPSGRHYRRRRQG